MRQPVPRPEQVGTWHRSDDHSARISAASRCTSSGPGSTPRVGPEPQAAEQTLVGLGADHQFRSSGSWSSRDGKVAVDVEADPQRLRPHGSLDQRPRQLLSLRKYTTIVHVADVVGASAAPGQNIIVGRQAARSPVKSPRTTSSAEISSPSTSRDGSVSIARRRWHQLVHGMTPSLARPSEACRARPLRRFSARFRSSLWPSFSRRPRTRPILGNYILV